MEKHLTRHDEHRAFLPERPREREMERERERERREGLDSGEKGASSSVERTRLASLPPTKSVWICVS